MKLILLLEEQFEKLETLIKEHRASRRQLNEYNAIVSLTKLAGKEI